VNGAKICARGFRFCRSDSTSLHDGPGLAQPEVMTMRLLSFLPALFLLCRSVLQAQLDGKLIFPDEEDRLILEWGTLHG
jgi:hypothetical protein